MGFMVIADATENGGLTFCVKGLTSLSKIEMEISRKENFGSS